MSDWLQETYESSIGHCKPLGEADLVLLAELTAEVGRQHGRGETDVATILEQLQNPFLTNFLSDKGAEEIYTQAAKMTRVKVRFGAPFRDIAGYPGLYCDDKGFKDLGEFWKAVRAQENVK